MSAATTDIYTIAQAPVAFVNRKVEASTKIPQGVLVATNAAGYLVNLSDAANLTFDGFAEGAADNTSGAQGAISCKVTPRHGNKLGCIEVDATSPDQSWINQILCAADNHTVALPATTSHVVRVGRCVDVTTTGVNGRVIIDTNDIVQTNLAGS